MPRKQRLFLVLAATTVAALLLVFLMAIAQASPAAPLAPNAVTAMEYVRGLDEPIDIANTGIPTDTRLFVTERDGRIRIIHSNGVTGTLQTTPFLDIDSKVNSTSNGEMGLLGLAFSPNYANDGRFYVFYTDNAGDLQLSQFTVSSDPNVASITETLVLNIPHPVYGNHN